ncbi:MAG: Stk1 family PASTA domain-containing Ser/Thr kinase [Ruminococcaceae bacterium]|nr:Stk1 family PASTA domain-containing Ser/Thr kinase [Oscillospiraceae bacterium]
MDKYLGKRLDGRYEMRELIGIGGMAYVYKAYDSVDDRVVAVKILKDEYLNNEEFVRRFRNESKAIAILNHENIVKVLDVGFGERLQYIVMEYIDGITLKEYLDQRKEIRWKEAVHFAIQILRALQHAHDKGIVHRDIKPQNVMLLSDGTIKVTDFGIARLTRSEVQVTVVGNKAIGSVHYISPEQARGEITDEKADLYSVGIVLYEMLTGKLPFEADNAVSVAIMQMQTEAKAPHLINEEIPGGLEQITLKAMQKDTARRYQSAAEMLSDFEEFKRNPSIKFEYTYFQDETPTRYVDAITRIRGTEPETATNKEVPEKAAKKKKKRMPVTDIILPIIAAIIVVALAVLGMVLLGVFGGDDDDDKKDYLVPVLIGLQEEQLETLPELKNFKVEFNREFSEKHDVGVIYNQTPASKTKLKEGSIITVWVSKGPQGIEVPKVRIGASFKNEKARLEDAGFKVKKEVSDVHNPEYKDKEDAVVAVYPEDNYLPEGSEITLVVNGKAEKEGTLPDVSGRSLESAKNRLKEANFLGNETKQLKITYRNHPSFSKDFVIEMIPAGGEEITYEYDGVIELVVASGYKDAVASFDLPQNYDKVDLQFSINLDEPTDAFDKLNKTYKGYSSKNCAITFAEPEKEYTVTVSLAPAGTSDYQVYATITVDGKSGSAQVQIHPLSVPEPTPDDTVGNLPAEGEGA